MKIIIKHPQLTKQFEISVPLYAREDCLGIDFDNGVGQIIIDNVTDIQAKDMIRELQAYIDGTYQLKE